MSKKSLIRKKIQLSKPSILIDSDGLEKSFARIPRQVRLPHEDVLDIQDKNNQRSYTQERNFKSEVSSYAGALIDGNDFRTSIGHSRKGRQ